MSGSNITNSLMLLTHTCFPQDESEELLTVVAQLCTYTSSKVQFLAAYIMPPLHPLPYKDPLVSLCTPLVMATITTLSFLVALA